MTDQQQVEVVLDEIREAKLRLENVDTAVKTILDADDYDVLDGYIDEMVELLDDLAHKLPDYQKNKTDDKP